MLLTFLAGSILMIRQILIGAVVFAAFFVAQGCCAYHPETVAEMNQIKQKAEPLFKGFTEQPGAGEAMKVTEINAIYEQSAEREKTKFPQCGTLHESILKSQQIFKNDVKQRNDEGKLGKADADLLLDQLNRSVDEVIATAEARKQK
jgi:hypothetical protein